jgi:hypothetical protein
MQGHLLQKHLQLQQPPDRMRLISNCRRAWGSHQQRCPHVVDRLCTRLAALPVQPSTAGQDQQQQDGPQQRSSNGSSKLVQLVEVQDRRKTTYSWQDTSSGSSSNGSSVTVQHEQQQEEQDGKQLLPSLPGRQQLLDALKTLYLPAGYPNTVTGKDQRIKQQCNAMRTR